MAIKSGTFGTKKKNFCHQTQSNQEHSEPKKSENEAQFSKMSNKMRLYLVQMSRFTGIERRICFVWKMSP